MVRPDEPLRRIAEVRVEEFGAHVEDEVPAPED
jgi:hypothetical protein